VTTIDSQVGLYRCLEASVPQLSRELRGCTCSRSRAGCFRDRDQQTASAHLADLKGLRIRAPSELLAVLRELGATRSTCRWGSLFGDGART
jgi:hypothetical protein